MNYIASNLKNLRKQKGLTQTELANKIGVKRPMIGSYEEGRAEPKLTTLQNISRFFKINIDDLLEKDLTKSAITESKDISGGDLRILPVIVNEKEEERITAVPVKAAAGYLNGYADPEFVGELPTFNLPLNELPQDRTYRAFQIKGDSMLPVPPNSYILSEYLADWNNIRDGKCYIVLTKNDGVVYKRLYNEIPEHNVLKLKSDNSSYETYTVGVDEILEVWKAMGFVSFDLPEPDQNNASMQQLTEMMMHLKGEVEKMKK